MKKTEICHHCNVDYIPNRRGVQKFCSNSCRSRFWYLKQNFESRVTKVNNQLKVVEQKSNIDEMSLAGVGNAAAGMIAANALKDFLTREENKPATKGDLKSLSMKLEQFQEIVNMENDVLGRKPFYDSKSKRVVYKSYGEGVIEGFG